MNIIFEGISGCGKTTTINCACGLLDEKKVPYEKIGDLEYDTPIREVLLDMVAADPFMDNKQKFKTSLYESLLLAANHHYTQEKLRDSGKLCIYDRDFISLLAYQKEMLKKDYSDYLEIYDSYRKIVEFRLKEVDCLVYMDIPFDVCIDRTQKRDKRNFTAEEIELEKRMKRNMEEEIARYIDSDKLIVLNDDTNTVENAQKVLRKVGI